MLDFAVDEASFGKPSGGADLRLGLATAPTLYAWEEFEEMGPLIERRFEGEGDVELVGPLLYLLVFPPSFSTWLIQRARSVVS
jgi:hexaprenyl-diphosphate synthase